MASLSVPLPWQSFVAPRLPELQAELHRDWPGITLRLEAGEEALLAHLVVEPETFTRNTAAYLAAAHLAPLWPGFLSGYEVSLVVDCQGVIWTAPAVVQDVLASEGMALEAWFQVVVWS